LQPRRPALGPAPRRRPQLTRSITVDQEGPNRPREGRLIPWPEVPAYPVLADLAPLTPGRKAEDPGPAEGLLALGHPLFTTAGKTALGWAFKAAGLRPGDRVLLPAYHCLAMVDPLEWLGLEPVFYRLHEDLSIDYAHVEACLDSRCRALVAVHYFGFPQDGLRLRAFCDDSGLALIEDCAHSFFGSQGDEKLGSFGDFAIGSLPKFFPLHGGGCLVSARRPLPRAELTEQGTLAGLQALVRGLQTAHYYGRLRPLLPATTGAAALTKLLALSGLGREAAGAGNGASALDYTADRLARTTLRASTPGTIASRRRENYETLCRMLSDLPGITLLKPRLEPGVVPYMLPLRIPALRRLFARLEDQAFPMQRFGQFLAPGLDEALCLVSSDLSHHGLQLPCHQSLRGDEMEWMAERLADICRPAGHG
jgi:dTDP-4-amino-4,6-dideoxygalactose transaminase